MNKKFISFVTLFFVGIFFTNIASADDAGPRVTYSVNGEKNTCVSIANLEKAGDYDFYLFDYSPELGEKMGKPWSIMESGKCYELDGEKGAIYRISNYNVNIYAWYSDYTNFEVTDDITEIDNSVAGNRIEEIWPVFCMGGVSGEPFEWEMSRLEIINFTGVDTYKTMPVKYNFIDLFRMKHLIVPDYSPLEEIKMIYKELNDDLEDVIMSCDNRIGVEYQLDIGSKYGPGESVIWKFDNDKVFAFHKSDNLDSIKVIDLIGCRESFGDYIDSHMDDFEAIDELTYEFVNENSDEVDYFLNYEKFNRDEASTERVLNFANTDDSIEGYVLSDADDIIMLDEKSELSDEEGEEVLNSDDIIEETIINKEQEEMIVISEPDEPTPEKKVDMLVNSSNMLIRLYALLPIFALFGMVVFLIFKNKKK